MKHSSKKNVVEVEIRGGLGNQLFTYFAGLYLSVLNDSKLRLKICQPAANETVHGDSISELNLKGDFFFEEKRNICERFTMRVIAKLARSIQFFSFIRLHLLRRYNSSEIGFDHNVKELKPPIVLMGYFQSWRYFDAIKDKINQPIEILKPSEWYREFSAKAVLEKPIVLHIRRGDYTNPINSNFGLLSGNYYRRALEMLPEDVKLKQVWVFSDDPDQAKETLRDLKQYNFVWIEPPTSESAVESLLLMSLGSANIIANSTFSWWGAMLNRTGQVVIAPSKWFKSQEDPRDLIPDSWIRVESDWV
jgi:hypothetical protein